MLYLIATITTDIVTSASSLCCASGRLSFDPSCALPRRRLVRLLLNNAVLNGQQQTSVASSYERNAFSKGVSVTKWCHYVTLVAIMGNSFTSRGE